MAARQLSDGNPDGTVLGQSAADPVGFHGVTPIARASVVTTTITTLTVGASAAEISTAVNATLARLLLVQTALANKGLIANS